MWKQGFKISTEWLLKSHVFWVAGAVSLHSNFPTLYRNLLPSYTRLWVNSRTYKSENDGLLYFKMSESYLPNHTA